jgi:hypothetical protein
LNRAAATAFLCVACFVSDASAKDVCFSTLVPRGAFKTSPTRGEHYAIVDPNFPTRFYAIGAVKKGVLDLEFKLVERDEKGMETARSTAIRGSDAFGEILAAYGDQVERILGYWNEDHRDNLDTFNRLIQPPHSLSPQEAALNTFTGKMAARAGFSVPTLDKDQSLISPVAGERRYTRVVVFFDKPSPPRRKWFQWRF